MLAVHEDDQGLTFRIFVQPRSSKNEITGQYGDALKVKLTAPPVNGSANKMCLKYLAKRLAVPKSSLEIVTGHHSRAKTIRIYLKKEDSQKEVERIKRFLMSFNSGTDMG